MVSWSFGTIIAAQVVHLVLGQQPPCGIPMDLRGQPVDPSQMVGSWYEFMYRTPPIRSINTIHSITPMGHNGGDPYALANRWTISFYINNSPQPPTCTGIFLVTNATLDGKVAGTTFRPDPSPVTYTILATDYNTFKLSYRCASPDRTRPICENPFFWIDTRVVPTQLDPTTINNIRERAAAALRPYCWTLDQLSITPWNLTMPACNPTVPTGFIQLAQQVRANSSRLVDCRSQRPHHGFHHGHWTPFF